MTTLAMVPDLAAVEALVDRRLHSHVLQSPLAPGVRRAGVMLHYDDSSRDAWAVEWFMDPRCTNGYTWLVLDDGRVVELANPLLRTPHAGACRVPNANSLYYGIAVATNGLVPATAAQRDMIVRLCARLARAHDWDRRGSWITGHDTMAIWTPKATRAAGYADAHGRALWGKVGRKVDPTGVRTDGVPVLDVATMRTRVSDMLRGAYRLGRSSCPA